MKRRATWVLCVLFLALLWIPALAEKSELDAFNSTEVIIGVPTGAASMDTTKARFPNAKIQYLTVDNDGYISVLSGKINAYAHDSIILKYACEDNPKLRLLDETYGETDIAVGISRKRADLTEPVNAFIRELIDSGMRDDMTRRWFTDASNAMPSIPDPETPDKTLRIGTSGIIVPMTYFGADQALTGLDIEMMKRLGLKLNAKIEISVMNYDALIAGLESGKLDLVIAELNITPERAERITYSVPYMTTATGLVVRNETHAAQTGGFQTVADFQAHFGAGTRLGVSVGTIQDDLTKAYFPDAQRVYLNTNADLIIALETGKIDGYLVDKPQGYAQCLTNKNLWMPDIQIEKDEYGIALKLGNEELLAQMNEIIARFKTDGTFDALAEKWFLTDESQKPMTDIPLSGENGVLRMVTSGDGYPFTYIRNGEPVGYSIETFAMLCAELGYGMDVDVADFPGVIAAVSSGKADAASDCISITDERKEQMLFTEPTYSGGVMMMLPATLRPGQTDDLHTVDGIAQWVKGKRVGMYIGYAVNETVDALLSESEMVWMNSFADMAAAIRADRIDCFLCDVPIAVLMCQASEGLYTPEVLIYGEDYAFAMKQGNDALMKKLNATIQRLKADGTLEKLRAKWTTGDPSTIKMPDIQLAGENGTLKIATDAEDAPFGYIANGEMIGYDYELLMLFAEEHGYGLEFDKIAWDALPTAVASGKFDIACGCLSVTEEHAQAVIMSDAIFAGGMTLVMSDQYAPAQSDDEEEQTGIAAMWASISASFERTFIRENRWKLIVEGLWTTLIISVCAALLGTALGFGVCMARRSRVGVLSGIARIFIRIMQGTPIVVFLMILYYIIFGDVEPILVAVIGFALNFAAYVSEMMRTGIDAVDKGQIEAASAIGFTKARAFLLITLPQAARHFLPVFRGEFISLVKMTSVVGYISIMDLTKMSDIIRSRTYEAFFPLIATAVIYFLLSWLLAQSLSAIELRIDPKRKKRVVKGVREEEIRQ